MKYFGLENIGCFRLELMGMSTIGIIVCHAIVFNVELGHLNFIFNLGNLGVDIFYLLSGFGIYYSLKKRLSVLNDYYRWYKKRLLRILIPYAILVVPFLVIYCILNHKTIGDFFYYITFASYFGEHFGLWFIPSILLLYIIAPCYKLLYDNLKYRFSFTLIFVLFITIICAILSEQDINSKNILYNIICLICRTPSFFIGYYIADVVDSKRKYPPIVIFIFPLFIHLILYFVLEVHFSWWWLYSLPISILLSQIPRFINLSCIKYIGNISLESYMTNWCLIILMNDFLFLLPNYLIKGNYIPYIIIIVFGLLLAILVNKLSHIAFKKIKA